MRNKIQLTRSVRKSALDRKQFKSNETKGAK